MRRTPLSRALAGLVAGASVVVALSGCAAKPQDSNTSNGVYSWTPSAQPAVTLPTITAAADEVALTETGAACTFCAIIRGEVLSGDRVQPTTSASPFWTTTRCSTATSYWSPASTS